MNKEKTLNKMNKLKVKINCPTMMMCLRIFKHYPKTLNLLMLKIKCNPEIQTK